MRWPTPWPRRTEAAEAAGGPFSHGATWRRAQHGAEWPEEGLVLPRLRARAARRRRGEVNPTGTRATVAPSTAPRAGDPEMMEQLVEVPKGRYQDGIQHRTAQQIVALPAPVLAIPERISEQCEVVDVPKISSQERVEAVKSIPQERISERRCE